DAAGNMTAKTVETETPTGVTRVTEVRDDDDWPVADRINELNQKDDDSEVWEYEWSDENRLINVARFLNGSSDPELEIAYTYDAIVRMLSHRVKSEGGLACRLTPGKCPPKRGLHGD